MAGAISGNLSPMWRSIANVLRGGGIPNEQEELRKFINEGISGRNRTLDIPHSDIRGGVPNVSENIYGRNERRAIQVSNSDDIKRGYP